MRARSIALSSTCQRPAGLGMAVVAGLLCLLHQPVAAQVQALKQTTDGIVLGTSAFNLTVRPTGTVNAIKVGDTVLFPFIALYTFPLSTEDGAQVRCCQAETPGLGDRPAKVETEFSQKAATVTIQRECSHPKVYHDEPLWQLRETVTVEAAGLVQITYDCRFLRFLPGMSLTAVFAGAMKEFTGHTWQADVPSLRLSGAIPGSLPKRDETAGLWELTLDSSQGPVRCTFGDTSRVEVADWGQYLEVGAAPPGLPHGEQTMFRGVEQTMTITLKLPVK